MLFPPFKKLTFKDQDLVTVQENVGRTLDPISQIPFLDGVMLENITIPTSGYISDFLFPHKLGRAWRGYIVTYAYATSLYSLTDDINITYDKTKFIYLSSLSANPVTLNVWVF